MIMIIRTIIVSVILIVSGCSSKPVELTIIDDALKTINSIEQVVVPDDAYDALTPEINDSPSRFDVIAKSNSANAFFHGLVDGMGINILVDPSIKTRITLKLKDVTLEETLEAVKDVYGLQYITTSYGYRILPKTLQNRVFPVNYLNVSRTGSSGMSVSSGSISTSDTNNNSSNSDSNSSSNSSSSGNSQKISTATKIETLATTDFWLNLQSSVSMIVGNGVGRRVIVDAQSGLVVVRGYPDELAAVEDFLNRAEISLQKQVIIEAKILEVTLNSGFQSGIQWDTLPTSGTDLAGQLTSETVRNADDLGGVFSLSFNGSDFSGVIQMLQRQGEVQVLSSPRISTVNNQKAVIKVGTDEFFVTNIGNSTTTTTTTTSTAPEISLTPFFSGIALDVTPQIGQNNEVILHVHPSVTEVVERNKVIDIGGAIFDLPLAYSSIRETDSIIRAASGQVVVIGGLLQNKKSSVDASVPWLSKIPILGHLFRQVERTNSKSELVILLQPTVIEPTGWNNEIKDIQDSFPRWQQKGAAGSAD
ncbi:MAG: MSHA biogenesis protein MshL [Francisellaceae bacterium]|jgi:MSHA biogenesis protein MshL